MYWFKIFKKKTTGQTDKPPSHSRSPGPFLESQALSSFLNIIPDIRYLSQFILHNTEISQQYVSSMRAVVVLVFDHCCTFTLVDSNSIVPVAQNKNLEASLAFSSLMPHTQSVNKSYQISRIWALLSPTIQASILSHLEFYNGLLSNKLLPSLSSFNLVFTHQLNDPLQK